MSRQDGFTLIELIVGVAILGIVFSVLTASMVVGFRTTDATQTRLSESHDAHQTSAYFATDVGSAETASLDDSGCAGVTPLISFDWWDGTVLKTASYVVTGAGSGRKLTRTFCSDDTTDAAPYAVVDSVTISHNLASVGPTVECSPACPGTGTSRPNTVKIAITERGGFGYQLIAARRTS